MFNILSGLQEGSHSVAVISRPANTGQTFTMGMVAKSVGGKYTVAQSADSKYAEFIFEDITTNTSGKYTAVFGSFEGQTDQIDDSTNGAISVDDMLGVVNGYLAKASAGDISAGNLIARVTAVTAAGVDPALGTVLSKMIQFRTL